MRCFAMFVTAVCVLLFLLKLKWPKNKSFYDLVLAVDGRHVVRRRRRLSSLGALTRNPYR